MRVTNKMLANNYLTDMNSNLNNLKTIQQQMSSGKNFTKPSDDPFNVARAMQMHSAIDANTQYNANITNTINWMDTTDTALGQLGNVFQNIRTSLVSAGNAAYNSDERTKIKDEINQRVSQVSQILNTNFAGEYIFGGTKGASKPMDTVNNYIVNKSNSQGGDISISGTATKLANTNYKITVTGSDQKGNFTGMQYSTSTDGGATWSTPASTAVPVAGSPNNFTVDGLNIKLDTNLNTKDNDTYNFSLVKNNKLIYTSDKGEELKSFSDVESAEIDSANIVSNWSSKDITFNINGTEAKITLDSISATPPPTIDDLITNINNKINSYQTMSNPPVSLLKGKIDVGKTTDGKIKFSTINSSDIVSVTDTTVGNQELVGAVGKQLSYIQFDMISTKRQTEISQGVLVDYNVSASDVIKYGEGDDDDLRSLLSRIVNHLDGKDNTGVSNETEATKALTNKDLTDLDKAIKQALKVRSEVGAKENRMDSAKEQNVQGKADMTDILSKTEDIDITEKTMEFATMQTVYLAALQTSAKVLQPTLMDYMR